MFGSVPLLLTAAVVSNLIAIYYLKPSRGLTEPGPTAAVVVSILVTQWLVARALMAGGQVGLSITAVVVSVMIGAGVIGWWSEGEKLTAWELVGYAMAVAGVVVANVAHARAAAE